MTITVIGTTRTRAVEEEETIFSSSRTTEAATKIRTSKKQAVIRNTTLTITTMTSTRIINKIDSGSKEGMTDPQRM